MTTTPPSDPPTGGETLEQGGGEPVARGGSPAGGRRLAIAGVAGVAVLALAGGGVWAALSYFGTGDQPAQALPASTLAYLAVDLDPSGEQKLEALRTLEKFPAFTEETDIDSEDDLRRVAGDELIAESGCDLDYDDDVAPWLGNRFALAAVDLGEDSPSPVGVAQVSDADAAEEGLAALVECGGDSGTGFVVEGDWAVVADSEELAQQAVDEAADAALVDDEAFTRWTDEVGDPGVVSGYLAPDFGTVLADLQEELVGSLGEDGDAAAAEDLSAALEGFEGAGMAVRFADGSLEVEVASAGSAVGSERLAGDAGAAAMSSLPEGTVAALGVGFEPGWAQAALDALQETRPLDAQSLEEQLGLFEDAFGIVIPEDLESLLGESAVLALGPDANLEDLSASEDLSGLPVALKVLGDPAAVEDVLERAREIDPAAETLLQSETEGDAVAVGPSPDYLADVVGEGGLGSSAVFEDVVREADRAGLVLFVDFDGVEDLAAAATGDDPTVTENLAPLAGLGFAAWNDEGTGHAVLRVTTD